MSIIIIGCAENGGGSGGGGQMEQFRGGSSFVDFTLEPGSPPSTILDSGIDIFDISLKIENNGEWDIEPNSIRILLENFDEARWGDNSQKNFVIANQMVGFDSLYNIEGDFEYVTFANLQYLPELSQNSFTHNYLIRACHPYGTKVAFTACIDNQARRSQDQTQVRLCEGFSNREFSVSSGPIDISRIEQQVINGRLRLIFTIRNNVLESTDVTLFSPGSLNDMCRVSDGITENQVRNGIQLSLTDDIVGEFSCGGDGSVSFSGGVSERTIVCESDISDLSVQELPMLLNIEYDVLKNMRNSIRVERSN
ncbi:MAG: hypothetical protein ACMXYB_02315 [Candidatus Woesearchaeota archaeon]